jgi:hypothetical protein
MIKDLSGGTISFLQMRDTVELLHRFADERAALDELLDVSLDYTEMLKRTVSRLEFNAAAFEDRSPIFGHRFDLDLYERRYGVQS